MPSPKSSSPPATWFFFGCLPREPLFYHACPCAVVPPLSCGAVWPTPPCPLVNLQRKVSTRLGLSATSLFFFVIQKRGNPLGCLPSSTKTPSYLRVPSPFSPRSPGDLWFSYQRFREFTFPTSSWNAAYLISSSRQGLLWTSQPLPGAPP